MHGDPRSPSPPPSPCEPAGPPCICQGPGPGRRAGRTRRRARPLPNARRATFRPTTAKTATRPIRRASLPAAPRPSGLPPADTEEPAPRGDLGMRAQRADASSYMPYFAAAWRRATLALMHGTTPTARTPTIAVTQAADESKGVSQPYPYLRPGPLRIHKAVLLRPSFQGPAQRQTRFPVIRHRNRPISQTPAAAIAPFVHWDIRAQTAGIYLPIH